MKKIGLLSLFLVFQILFFSCSTTKSKQDVKGLKKLYHNTTAKFNGYFNAEELMNESIADLQAMQVDNYNSILSVYDYVEVENPQSIKENMDKAIEKVSVVATVHDVSNYVDDCYLIIGKAQYLKQDYIAAEETFEYFEEVFDPRNPYGRAYDSKSRASSSGRRSKKEIKQARKELIKEREDEKKLREEERKLEEQKREEERKAREDERKEEQKQREQEKKEREKARKKGRSSSKSRSSRSRAERDASKTPETPVTTTEETVSEDRATEIQMSDAEREALIAAQEQIAEESAEEERRRKKLEDDKEAKRKKEEEKFKNQGEGAIFKNKSAYVEGLYWLGRTYIETRRFSSAEYIFKQLEETPGLKDDVANKIPAARAHMYLRTKEYKSALDALDEAIEKEKDRNLKARYAFIKAQLYEGMNANQNAYTEYNRAKKFSTKYELDFNARLNEIKLGYREGSLSQKKALNKLQNMLEDKKNINYADQVHFTIAQIYLDSGDKDVAIAAFEQAINSSGTNPNVKLEAYYRLAELLFDNDLYLESKSNYDKVLEIMSKTDERYRTVEKLSENLSDIAQNIETIQLQDSLLSLSKLSEAELRELATEIVEERLAAGDQVDSEKDNFRKSNIISSNRQLGGAGRSNFFAYNPVVLNQGKVEFKRVWGDRVQEDNWRRSLRTDVGLTAEEIILQEEEEEEITVTEDQIREVLRDVPRNPTQIASSEKRIQNSLFQLGILFRERLRNYEKSVEVLERLINEFPDYEKRDEALFYLFLSYQDLDMTTDAKKILVQMRQEFPDSKFTKLATDPNYGKELQKNADSIEKYYDDTFDLFEQGEYETVITRVSEKNKLYAKDKTYAPKFALLNAMSLGSTQGKNDYVNALEQLIRSYPKTVEEIRAKEILRFLKGDAEAFDQILYEEALDDFEDAPEKLHYIFIVTYGLDQKTFDDTKVEILNYNKKFHRFDNLKISNIYLNQQTKARIILVRSFDDKEKAMKYYDGVQKNKSLFIANPDIGYDIFAVTQKNYREVIKQKGINNYRAFYDQKYLKGAGK